MHPQFFRKLTDAEKRAKLKKCLGYVPKDIDYYTDNEAEYDTDNESFDGTVNVKPPKEDESDSEAEKDYDDEALKDPYFQDKQSDDEDSSKSDDSEIESDPEEIDEEIEMESLRDLLNNNQEAKRAPELQEPLVDVKIEQEPFVESDNDEVIEIIMVEDDDVSMNEVIVLSDDDDEEQFEEEDPMEEEVEVVKVVHTVKVTVEGFVHRFLRSGKEY